MNSRRGLTVAATVLMCVWLPRPLRAEILVSAASSLTDVMTRIAVRFEGLGGEHVALNVAASNTLARQIAAGARVDVFVSADEAQMDRVSGDLVQATRIDLLSNQLAIAVARHGTVPTIRSPQDLLGPAIRRIAIGDPAAVPAGVYAQTYFVRLGLWERLQPKLAPAGSVRLALAAVESGAADAAVVYVTDVATARDATTAFVVSAPDGPNIRYPAAITKAAPNPSGARRFLQFLQGAEARALFRAAGFGMIASEAVRP